MALTLEGLEKWYENTYKLKCAFAGETPLDPVPLPDVTTIDGLLEGIANESESALIAVAQNTGHYHDYDDAYTLQLPAKIKRWYGIKKVGGRTILFNQVSGFNASTWSGSGVSITYEADGTTTLSGQATADLDKTKQTQYSFISGHVYAFKGSPEGSSADTYYMNTSIGRVYAEGRLGKFTSSGKIYVHYVIKNGVDVDGVVFKCQIFDLTVMFGEGKEPATIGEFNAIFPNDYYAPNSGELISAGVTAIVSKDGDDVVETITIPAEIQALTGYGISCPDNVNYIDFETQKFYQYVGSRDYESGDESDADVITDGTTTHYPLDTPVETDISLSVDNLQIVEGGTITFENQHEGDYNIPVPIDVEYIS